MTRVLIKVTEEDIKKGIALRCMNCPIALAVNRSLVFSEKVSVGSRFCHTDKESIPLSRSARRFIRRFDKQKPVKPFNFYLRLPE